MSCSKTTGISGTFKHALLYISSLRKFWFLLPFQWSKYQRSTATCSHESCATDGFQGRKNLPAARGEREQTFISINLWFSLCPTLQASDRQEEPQDPHVQDDDCAWGQVARVQRQQPLQGQLSGRSRGSRRCSSGDRHCCSTAGCQPSAVCLARCHQES